MHIVAINQLIRISFRGMLPFSCIKADYQSYYEH